MDKSIIEKIKSRRSVRKFKKDPVGKDLIEIILEAGRFAPSALNRQPWRFIVIDDARLIDDLFRLVKKRIGMIYKLIPVLKFFAKDLRDQRAVNALKKTAENAYDTVFYNAPLLLFIANDTRFSDTDLDCSLSAQNMMLAAHSLGIGSCFIGRGKFIPKGFLKRKLNLPRFYDVRLHLAFGYPQEYPTTIPARKKDDVTWVE